MTEDRRINLSKGSVNKELLIELINEQPFCDDIIYMLAKFEIEN